MGFYFYLVSGLATFLGIAFAVSTKGILYHTPDTDNELMAYAAAQFPKWRWFSDIHKYGIGKTSMKDVSIILIALFQKVMRDWESDRPYTVLTGFTVSVSAILIYLIGANYWEIKVALFVSLIYLFSIWPWQTALYGGHINVANMFFLISIYIIQRSTFVDYEILYLILAGAFFCCTMFSSASSSKYLVSFWASVFYTKYHTLINSTNYHNLYLSLPFNSLLWLNAAVFVITIATITISFGVYKKVIHDMYFNKSFSFLNRLIKNQSTLSLDHYTDRARNKLKVIVKIAVWIIVMGLVVLNSVNIKDSWPIFAGFMVVFMIFTAPNPIKNFKKYISYLLHPRKKTHFRAYMDYIAQKGITVYRNTRGAGWPWIPRVLWRIAPIYLVVFLISFGGLLILRLNRGQYLVLLLDLVVLAIATSPIWWAEFTKAPQMSRTYLPGFITSLLFVGYSSYHFIRFPFFNFILVLVLCLVFVWNIWKFLSDSYPTRMGATRLVEALNRLNIKEFYTYRTSYNKGLVETIPGLGESAYAPRKKIKPPFSVSYINSLNEVKNGWIVIPGTNGISITMDGEPEAINNNFIFTKDPILNRLLKSQDIEKIATKKIKTYGNSQIWPLECEVLGYLDLFMHEVSKEKLYRGYAWLINTEKLKEFKYLNI